MDSVLNIVDTTHVTTILTDVARACLNSGLVHCLCRHARPARPLPQTPGFCIARAPWFSAVLMAFLLQDLDIEPTDEATTPLDPDAAARLQAAGTSLDLCSPTDVLIQEAALERSRTAARSTCTVTYNSRARKHTYTPPPLLSPFPRCINCFFSLILLSVQGKELCRLVQSIHGRQWCRLGR